MFSVVLFSLQDKDKLLAVDALLYQHMTRLLGKGLEVSGGPLIG